MSDAQGRARNDGGEGAVGEVEDHGAFEFIARLEPGGRDPGALGVGLLCLTRSKKFKILP